MWGGKKARDNRPIYSGPRVDIDELLDFENELLDRCSCNTSVSDSGLDITVQISGRYSLPGTVEHDKSIVRQAFNKHISKGRLFIEII